jgi:hypothetical protein
VVASSFIISQLALFQLAGSIASTIAKEAVQFSRLLNPRFYVTPAVRDLFEVMLKELLSTLRM